MSCSLESWRRCWLGQGPHQPQTVEVGYGPWIGRCTTRGPCLVTPVASASRECILRSRVPPILRIVAWIDLVGAWLFGILKERRCQLAKVPGRVKEPPRIRELLRHGMRSAAIRRTAGMATDIRSTAVSTIPSIVIHRLRVDTVGTKMAFGVCPARARRRTSCVLPFVFRRKPHTSTRNPHSGCSCAIQTVTRRTAAVVELVAVGQARCVAQRIRVLAVLVSRTSHSA
jgi:hypothetical protein